MTKLPDESTAYHMAMQPAPVDYVPRRVVSLVPSLTESLFDLDLGDRLVGVTDYCVRPAAQVQFLPKVGGTKNPDIKRIVALQPDLILMNREENRREDAEALAAAELVVWATEPRSVFDALNVLWHIMDVFDHAVMVPRVREIERAYDYTQAAAITSDPVRVFAPIWRDPWMTFSRGTYAHDILRVCGGENVFAGDEQPSETQTNNGPVEEHPPEQHTGTPGQRYPCITLDQIVASQPDVVLLPDEPHLFTEHDALELRRLAIPAAQTGRIYLIDGSLLTWHGTRTAYALRDLPGLLMGA